MLKNKTQKINPAKIIGIKFSIPSPESIRNGSVAEITLKDTYNNNKPVIGGLFDPRMGVLDPGMICPTDGKDYINCPGYFGHINLAKPVFYKQFLSTLIKIHKCICYKCGKLLINKEENKHLMQLEPEERWKKVYALANKIDKCGQETDDGCGFRQPKKIKNNGLANIIADWGKEDPESKDNIEIPISAEDSLAILRRLSDEDIAFMGFCPYNSRPEWMICQVLAVPPPSVRPSVKQDASQRSEDDLTHILVTILKTNDQLQKKIQSGERPEHIEQILLNLQYYVSSLVNNKISGIPPLAQRSGRPLKSIMERLNGKHGRVRGNLMGKRVDYSARSVITPDPNLSIRELGIPMKIAMNITKPVIVNKRNINFLMQIVKNGPNKHPGAKIIERATKESIYLENVDRDSIKLNIGDTVHRHMMNGDPVLFNRQPTLHRMSMMCHIARIMPVGDTFRMNVGDTKPYNADFDGDEMNLHMPQSVGTESELKNLAAVPWQIISPANNKSIIGVFQDSLLGAFQITRKDITFDKKYAMDLLMALDNIDTNAFKDKERITTHDLLSQILPPVTLKYKTKLYDEEIDDFETSNNVIDIERGVIKRGQIEKGVLGDATKGLIQRICNDFGNMKSAKFIDDLQNIVTRYMKTSCFSVGISDLIANKETNEKISQVITDKYKDVQALIDETHLGIFENKTGKTDEIEFETRVSNILGKALSQAGNIGLKSLDENNRFVTMVKAGSKGGIINISQMISCLGQQQVDGKRVPYGFEDRTLPHFSKFDDSPGARGFVESSFISGLSPEELFFHAMGGRVGLIDTAVKTSQTGYIQRKLVKGLEDIKIEYDMTVRNSKGKIVQFMYGDDGFDTIRVENQILPLVTMSIEDIYNLYQMPSKTYMEGVYESSTITRINEQKTALAKYTKKLTQYMVNSRDKLFTKVFKNRLNKKIHIPVSFANIINNTAGDTMLSPNSLVDITPLEFYEIIDDGFNKLKIDSFVKPTELFKIMYYYCLNPFKLLSTLRFNKLAITLLVNKIITSYKDAIVSPGEMVGIVAAQSIGEPTTQMTLNTFHLAGVGNAKSNATRGVPRIEELLSLTENPKTPSCTVYLNPIDCESQEQAVHIMHQIEHTSLREIVDTISICFDPNDDATVIDGDKILMEQFRQFENILDECLDSDVGGDGSGKDDSKWIIRIELNAEEMLDKDITVEDINFALKSRYNEQINCIYSDYNSDNIVFRIRMTGLMKKSSKTKSLDQQDEIYKLKNFQDNLLDNLVLRGVKNISKVIPRKITDSMKYIDGKYKRTDTWVLDTDGTNLVELLGLDYIDVTKTITNDIQEIYNVFGIEAARNAILNEFSEVLDFDNTYINYHHLSILCDRMTYNYNMTSMFRHGINNDDIGPIAKASFEETPEMFMKAARHAELDEMRGLSANVMCGQEGYFGTTSFQVVLDTDEISKFITNTKTISKMNSDKVIDKAFEESLQGGICSTQNLTILSNAENIIAEDMGDSDSDESDIDI